MFCYIQEGRGGVQVFQVQNKAYRTGVGGCGAKEVGDYLKLTLKLVVRGFFLAKIKSPP